MEILGGFLPKISELFYDLQFCLQDYYSAKELPETGFAFVQGYDEGCQKNRLLIHKNTAKILIQERLLDPKSLHPALTYDSKVPKGYVEAEFEESKNFIPFDAEHAMKMDEEYRRIKSIKRPQRTATTKMALKVFREAKCERKEDFGKRIQKNISESLLETVNAPLVPYFSIANGGHLSDEYEFLDYVATNAYTLEFEEDMQKEELSDIPKGIVFCSCANGDKVLLAQNEKIYRITHEDLGISEEWSSLAQFFVDALEVE